MPDSILDRLSPLNAFRAKEFPPGCAWLNVKDPITLAQLRGNIVILDFWTYCCANCMHMLRELESIEERYRDSPVVVIGVHSAKFAHEKDERNIAAAIERYGITHPVVVDSDMRVWRAYGAQGWPTIVIVDPKGWVAYRGGGEGQTKAIEASVDKLLRNHAKDGSLKPKATIRTVTAQKRESTLSYPGKLAFSRDGKRIAVSDSGNDRILIVDAKGGAIEKKIGGTRGFSDGTFASARFHSPQGVSWPDANSIYVADTENHAIRRISLEDETVETIAGTGSRSHWLALGGDALKMALSSPWDIACSSGIIYIAMAGTHQIWAYGAGKGEIRPFVGSGFEGIEDGKGMGCLLAQPSGLSVSGSTLYFADSESSAVRGTDLETRRVETLVGSGLFKFGYRDGTFKEAQFQHPLGICADRERIYVADTYNNAIRLVDTAKRTVATVIGDSSRGAMCRYGDSGCDTLGLYEPSDVKINRGKLYIADTNNHLIRVFDLKTRLLSTLRIGSGADIG